VEDGKYTVWTGEPKQVAADASVTGFREQMCFSLSKKTLWKSLEVETTNWRVPNAFEISLQSLNHRELLPSMSDISILDNRDSRCIVITFEPVSNE
jgi:hypothetical protein